MEVRKRLQYLDICKGILIVLVVWGHCIPENNYIHKWIYSFHIPAFFIINGMGLQYVNYSNRPFIKGRHNSILFKTAKKLLIPYLIYGALILLFRWAFSGFMLDNLFWQIKDLFLFTGVGATWFLPCLFLAQLFYWGIVNIDQRIGKGWNIISVISSVVLFVATIIIPNINFITLILFRAFIGTGFILFGHFCMKIIKKSAPCHTGAGVIALIFFILHLAVFCITGMQDVALNTLSLKNPIVYIVNALLGTGFIITLSLLLDKLKLIGKWIVVLGRNSLFIMGTHQVIMLLCFIPIKAELLLNALFCMAVITIDVLLIFIIKYIKRKVFKKNGK